VWGDYKWDNIKVPNCGKLPDFSKDVNEDVLISQFLANRLKLKVGDAFNTFFMKKVRVNYLISGGLKSLGFLILDFKNSMRRIRRYTPYATY
jgi:hypothetical protein